MTNDHLILGCVIDRQTSWGTRLAAGDRQGGCQIGWMAVAFVIARRLVSFGEGNPFRHLDLFYVDFSHAGRGTTPDQGGYEEVFLEWVRHCSGGAPLSPGA